MSEVSIFTDIGVLKWNMDFSGTFSNIEDHLMYLCPTVPDNLINKSNLTIREYVLRNNDTGTWGIIFAISSTLQMLKQYNDVNGNILLHLRTEQLNKDVKIRCTAYKEIA